ncbi:concanavalin A-like lectin/glucanase [Ceraceosorus guamensis]|uniref:Concanavalin A-like lectin/glucanase n=1 Tax=Ceraceosorus guamensis TaxID=1522189 RepID=A0A316VUP6_9BASI|nr:concanavalin A-like lectin/glucanase [Ceraceosorus guamensis]PWN41319.1 concanavalin A-like lectin/glucanase [Ceraceosorus guamensis]
MKQVSSFAAIAAALTLSFASLTEALPQPQGADQTTTASGADGKKICERYGKTTWGDYTLNNNLWGQDQGSGQQCTTVGDQKSNAWSTNWKWDGDKTKVKSYANLQIMPKGLKLSDIVSLQTSWEFETKATGNYDVAYDLFTSPKDGGPDQQNQNEIMIWLERAGGANPIASAYTADGATPEGKIELAGQTWNYFKGQSNGMTTFSFLPPANVKSFNGDVNDFIKWLVEQKLMDGNQYLTNFAAGIEPYVGEGTFTTTSYKASLKSSSQTLGDADAGVAGGSAKKAAAAPGKTKGSDTTTTPTTTPSDAPTTSTGNAGNGNAGTGAGNSGTGEANAGTGGGNTGTGGGNTGTGGGNTGTDTSTGKGGSTNTNPNSNSGSNSNNNSHNNNTDSAPNKKVKPDSTTSGALGGSNNPTDKGETKPKSTTTEPQCKRRVHHKRAPELARRSMEPWQATTASRGLVRRSEAGPNRLDRESEC